MQIILGTPAVPGHNNCYLYFLSLNLTRTFFHLHWVNVLFFFYFSIPRPHLHLLSYLHSKQYLHNTFSLEILIDLLYILLYC